jgi:hypothetical protein
MVFNSDLPFLHPLPLPPSPNSHMEALKKERDSATFLSPPPQTSFSPHSFLPYSWIPSLSRPLLLHKSLFRLKPSPFPDLSILMPI